MDKITPEHFYEGVKNIVENCKNLVKGDGGYNIKRGQAKTSSGDIEDLFALFVASNLKNKSLSFLVDKTISFQNPKKGRAKSFRPDLAIINADNVLTQYFDIKTNLGWMRNIESYIKDKDSFVNGIQDKQGWITYGPKLGSTKQNIRFSEDLKYKMVVIYDGNINENQMRENIEIANELDNVELYILHNHKGRQIDKTEINRLFDGIKVI